MNVAWAKDWAANFDNVEKLMESYADDAKFEDVIIAQILCCWTLFPHERTKLREQAFFDDTPLGH